MKRSTKVWLLTATVLVLLGITIFGGVVMVLGWDLGKLSTASYETNAYEINEKYEGITIVADTADVSFLPSQDGKTSVVCFEEEKIKHKVEVKDGTLFVTAEDTKTWYERIGINFCSPSITVCLPEGDFGELSVITTTGDVTLPFELSFSSIDVRVSTGKVKCLASALGTVSIETTT